MKFEKLLFIAVCFIFLYFPCQAQTTPQEEAVNYFNEERYADALPIFKRLLTLFPKDPRYHYYTGVCMVQTNTDLPKAVDYLKFAADRPVPRDVYFFLGKACHYLYRFDDALDAYLRFQQFAERSDKDKLQCDMHIVMVKNAKKLTERHMPVDVYAIDTIGRNHLFVLYNSWLKSGKFKEKAEKTFSFVDSKSKATWTFIPDLLGKEQPVFESSQGSLKKNRDLVVVHKLDGGKWTRPENMGTVINSSFDEDYAYFDATQSVLYFASKGHNSMGGYDIFKSVYNPDARTWSEPENMGYPINSPYDDFLFVPSEDQSKAFFASNRETQGNVLKVYTIGFPLKKSSEMASQGFDFISGSRLNLSSGIKERSKTETASEVKHKPVTNTEVPKVAAEKKKTVPAIVLPKTEPVEKPVVLQTYPEELKEQKEYNEVLNGALQYQLQSDSLSRAAEEIRQTVPGLDNETEINKRKREVYLLEQHSKAAQLKADELYEKARTYEIAYAGKNNMQNNTPQVTDEMAKTAFSKNNEPIHPAAAKKQVQPKNNAAATKPDKTSGIIYDFRIMAKTPYKSAGDIPVNKPLPDGLLYRIQMGAFSKAIEADRFKGIVPISGETIPNTIVVKYYAGMFSRMTDAEKALIKIRECGFKDAYIVSFFNGKSIPINRAKEMERDYQ